MNNRQKQKRALLAVVLTVLLVVLIVLATAISCCAKDSAANSTQSNTKVIVSEILASNKQAVRDPMGTYSDYFELHNISGERMNISGYGVSDDETSMWVIAEGTYLEPDEYKVFWCAGQETGITNVTNFALSKDDVLRFSDPSGKPIITIDLSKTFSGLSYSYIDSGEWVNMAPTPGFPNTEGGIAAYERTRMADSQIDVQEYVECPVRVTELMASNGNVHKGPDGTYCDWIELYNNSSSEFDLSGFGLSDDITKPKKYTFPQGTKIGAYSYLVLYHTEVPVDGALCLDFGLSAQGETLVFTSAEDRIIDLIDFGIQERNTSYARLYINGMFDANAGFETTDKPTPGFDNTANGYFQFDEKENGEMGVHDIRMHPVNIAATLQALKHRAPNHRIVLVIKPFVSTLKTYDIAIWREALADADAIYVTTPPYPGANDTDCMQFAESLTASGKSAHCMPIQSVADALDPQDAVLYSGAPDIVAPHRDA